jgi:RNA polymerase sigma-70 factor, ECF subfamily
MTDEAIIGLVLNGNTHIFSELVDKYRDSVFGMAFRFAGSHSDAQDISQEVFIKIYKNLHRFNAKSKFSTWVYRLSYNACIDWTRSKKTMLNTIDIAETDEDFADSRAGPEDSYIVKQRRVALREAIYALKEKYRNILILFYFQGLAYDEIGEILDIPVKTVETQLYRARKQIKISLSPEFAGGEPDEMS